jgi:hypothetical protein
VRALLNHDELDFLKADLAPNASIAVSPNTSIDGMNTLLVTEKQENARSASHISSVFTGFSEISYEESRASAWFIFPDHWAYLYDCVSWKFLSWASML